MFILLFRSNTRGQGHAQSLLALKLQTIKKPTISPQGSCFTTWQHVWMYMMGTYNQRSGSHGQFYVMFIKN